MKEKMAEANTNMTNALNTMKTNVTSATTSIKNSISSNLSLGSSAYTWGKDICVEMASGINDNAYRVKNAASSLASAVNKTLGFSVPEEGPLSDADEYMPDFMMLMAEGIRKSKKTVLQSAESLAEAMSGVFGGLALPEMNTRQLAMAGASGGAVNNSRSVTINGLSVNVNGYSAQNDSDLANMVADRINQMLNEDDSVWGR